MITEDYVSFETAKLLKEKGFDVPCFAYYYVMPHKTVIAYDKDFPKNSDLCLIYTNVEFGSLPTLQMTMKWLRKMYDLYIILDFERPNCIEYKIYKYEPEIAKGDLLHYNYEESYEEAVESALKYCLEILI